MAAKRRRLGRRARGLLLGRDDGYVLFMGMLVMSVLLLLGGALLVQVQRNQQHVQRDRAYTQSLAIAEAGLNQYLWAVATGMSSEFNSFAIPGASSQSPHKMTYLYTDPYDGSTKGEYTTEVTPPSATRAKITVKVTGRSHQPVEQSRTVAASLGRPAFSEYVLLTDEEICIDTQNITELVTCARQTYNSGMFGGSRNGVWSSTVPAGSPSRALWQFPVQAVDFGTVTSDFTELYGIAQGTGVNIPYSTAAPHGANQGWYINLLPNKKYQIRRVTDEYEHRTYQSGNRIGGYLDWVNPSRAHFFRRLRLPRGRCHLRERQRLDRRPESHRANNHSQLRSDERPRQDGSHLHTYHR